MSDKANTGQILVTKIDFLFKKEEFMYAYFTTTKTTEVNYMLNESKQDEKFVPIWEKANLTLEEAAKYSGIGIHRLRALTDNERCEFVLWVGTKRLIKRKKLDEYLEKAYSI